MSVWESPGFSRGRGFKGLKRRNSLLEMARIFKSYEIKCVRLANFDA